MQNFLSTPEQKKTKIPGALLLFKRKCLSIFNSIKTYPMYSPCEWAICAPFNSQRQQRDLFRLVYRSFLYPLGVLHSFHNWADKQICIVIQQNKVKTFISTAFKHILMADYTMLIYSGRQESQAFSHTLLRACHTTSNVLFLYWFPEVPCPPTLHWLQKASWTLILKTSSLTSQCPPLWNRNMQDLHSSWIISEHRQKANKQSNPWKCTVTFTSYHYVPLNQWRTQQLQTYRCCRRSLQAMQLWKLSHCSSWPCQETQQLL